MDDFGIFTCQISFLHQAGWNKSFKFSIIKPVSPHSFHAFFFVLIYAGNLAVLVNKTKVPCTINRVYTQLNSVIMIRNYFVISTVTTLWDLENNIKNLCTILYGHCDLFIALTTSFLIPSYNQRQQEENLFF